MNTCNTAPKMSCSDANAMSISSLCNNVTSHTNKWRNWELHLGSTPGLGRAPGERKGYQLQYSGLENSMDCIVHGVAESDTTE